MTEPSVAIQTGSWEGLRERLPPIFRLRTVERLPSGKGEILNRAVLYHDQATLRVEWLSRHVDVRLTHGQLVSIRWLGRPRSVDGAVRIARLVRLDRPEPNVNLFETVPPSWLSDRELVRRAAALFDRLSRPMQHLFNAIFWEGRRFERLVTHPLQISNPRDLGGLVRNGIERAERSLAGDAEAVSPSLAVSLAACLLQEAGKTEEYRFDHGRSCYVLSERGALVSHRHTVIEWIAAARAAHNVIIPEKHYLTLIHLITATRHPEDWTEAGEAVQVDAYLRNLQHRAVGDQS